MYSHIHIIYTHTHIHTAQYIGIIVSGIVGGISAVVLMAGVVLLCVGVHMRHKWKVMQLSRDWLGRFTLPRR